MTVPKRLQCDHDWTRDYTYKPNLKQFKKKKGKYGPYIPLKTTRPQMRRAFTVQP